jgi:hypothetical protein
LRPLPREHGTEWHNLGSTDPFGLGIGEGFVTASAAVVGSAPASSGFGIAAGSGRRSFGCRSGFS